MKLTIKSAITSKQEQSPKRYIYEICDYLGYNVPRFTDPVAGGYRLRYSEQSKEDAEEGLEEIKQAANALGIKLVKALVKPGDRRRPWYIYVVVPGYYE